MVAEFPTVVGPEHHDGVVGRSGLFERIQQDAVMGAFNEDDWWFPTRMRGSRVWLAYGVTDDVRLRLSWFRERRDDLTARVDRLFLDMPWAW